MTSSPSSEAEQKPSATELDPLKDTRRGGQSGAGMKEIAERARVTKMTVSRALRTPSKVAPATLVRIENAMKELDFIPNYLAGSLASSSSRLVPVIVPTMASSIFSDFIEEITLTLDAAGFTPVFGCSNFDNDYEERLFKRYLGWQPSAVVLIGGAQTPALTELCRKARVPVIQTWNLPSNPVSHVVGFSNFQALRQMVLALHEWGHKHVGFGFIDTPDNDRSYQRRLGWESAVRECGGDPLLTRMQGGRLSLDDGAAIVRGILGRHPDTDAIAFGSDVLAVGAILECRRLGISVPGELAISGCGDMGLSSTVSPTLTTMHVPGRAMGRLCAEMVTQLVEGTYTGPAVVELETTLVRRESA